jgi:hypothetical protein
MEAEIERIRQEYQPKIDALETSITLLGEDVASDSSSEPDIFTDFPVDESLPEQVIFVLDKVGQVMQPKQIERFIKQYDESLRDYAVAEALSRMYKDGRIYRHKYNSNTNYYGLCDWTDDTSNGSEADFQNQYKPESLHQDNELQLE